jgi:ABC-type nitrate/sulfonate/bicarbonate transport system ATPase subunit
MQKNLNFNNKIVEFKDVYKIYDDRAKLRGMSFTIYKNEFICLIGPSGCGKSTIFKILAGMEAETSGTIDCHAKISMAFQNGALLPWLSVYDNIALVLKAIHTPKSEIDTEVMKYIGLMKLGRHVHSLPTTLSGGQKQRVGIARALVVKPELLLLDEPFSALDEKTTSDLHSDLLAIQKDMGITIIMITHQIEEAVTLADRVFVMNHGKVQKEVETSIGHPRREHELVFMKTVNEIREVLFTS